MKAVFPNLEILETNCNINKVKWTELFEEYELELINGNNNIEVIEKYLPKLSTPPPKQTHKQTKALARSHTGKHKMTPNTTKFPSDQVSNSEKRRSSKIHDEAVRVDITLDVHNS